MGIFQKRIYINMEKNSQEMGIGGSGVAKFKNHKFCSKERCRFSNMKKEIWFHKILMAERDNTIDLWSWIWSCKVSPKIKFFLWKISHRIIATKYFVNRRGVNLDTRCWWCSSIEEDIDHLFWGCPLASTFWSILTSWLSIRFISMPCNKFNLYSIFTFRKGEDANKRYWQIFVSSNLWSIKIVRNCFTLQNERKNSKKYSSY